VARWLSGPRLALVMLSVVTAGGTAGYMTIEGWGAWDALYMTVTTVATVGFREVHPLSGAGQAFTLLLIVSGVGTAFYTATSSPPLSWRAGYTGGSSAGASSACWKDFTTISSSAATGASAA